MIIPDHEKTKSKNNIIHSAETKGVFESKMVEFTKSKKEDYSPSVPLWTYPLERGGMSCWWLPASELL